MQWLPTALSTAAAVIGVIAAVFAVSSSLRLQRGLASLEALEARLDVNESSLRKLAGRFYVTLRKDRAEIHEEGYPVPGAGLQRRGVFGHEPGNGGCDNWALAQLEGPQSKAARCECDYCEQMRRARATVKAALVPRGAQAVAKFAEDHQ